jgi:hypothetical protein
MSVVRVRRDRPACPHFRRRDRRDQRRRHLARSRPDGRVTAIQKRNLC